MTAVLRPMSAENIPAWKAYGDAEFARSRVESGEPVELAEEIAALWSERLFPGGAPAEGQLVFEIIAEDEVVGTVWIGRQWGTPIDRWWVWDIEVNAEHRGKGYGRTAMELAAIAATENGASVLGLNVFGYNTVARGLYAALGYTEVSVTMEKTLGA